MIRVSGESKSKLLGAAGAESCGQRRNQKLHAAHFDIKIYKTLQLRSTFCSSDVEKLRAAVARSTFPNENVQSTSASDRFLKFRCRGEKHISRVKMLKTDGLGPLFDLGRNQFASARPCHT